MKPVFLTGEWKDLVMVNYSIDPELLQQYLPYGTELDFYQSRCYVSLVGFVFRNVRVLGFKIPFHVNFPEVNLRFYVRHRQNQILKRGVVFLSEIVPKHAIAFVANNLYHEKYAAAKMITGKKADEKKINVVHKWRWKNRWNIIQVTAESLSVDLQQGSEEEFITEHYWGYSMRNSGRTNEYQVEHPRWNIHRVTGYTIDCDFETLYGKQFAGLQQRIPDSVFLAEGSRVIIRKKNTYQKMF